MNNKLAHRIALVVFGIVWIALIVINLVWHSRPDFFDVSAGQMLSTIVVIIFSYFFVQLRTDDRKLADVAGKVIEKTEKAFDDYHTSVEVVIQRLKDTSFDPNAVEIARKKMLSEKKKVDSHVSMLKELRPSQRYAEIYTQLQNGLKEYHEMVESLPVSNAEPITATMETQLANKVNNVVIQLVSLYTETYK